MKAMFNWIPTSSNVVTVSSQAKDRPNESNVSHR